MSLHKEVTWCRAHTVSFIIQQVYLELSHKHSMLQSRRTCVRSSDEHIYLTFKNNVFLCVKRVQIGSISECGNIERKSSKLQYILYVFFLQLFLSISHVYCFFRSSFLIFLTIPSVACKQYIHHISGAVTLLTSSLLKVLIVALWFFFRSVLWLC